VKNFRTVIGTLFSFAEARAYISKGSNPVESCEKPKCNGGTVEIFPPPRSKSFWPRPRRTFCRCWPSVPFVVCEAPSCNGWDWADVDMAAGFVHGVAVEKQNSPTSLGANSAKPCRLVAPLRRPDWPGLAR